MVDDFLDAFLKKRPEYMVKDKWALDIDDITLDKKKSESEQGIFDRAIFDAVNDIIIDIYTQCRRIKVTKSITYFYYCYLKKCIYK